jgi:hypothetical protein
MDHHIAAHGSRLKIAGEGSLAYPIDDQISSQPMCQPLRFSDKILPGIQDHFVGARDSLVPLVYKLAVSTKFRPGGKRHKPFAIRPWPHPNPTHQSKNPKELLC